MKRIAKTESAAVATLGVDIGRNTFHLVGLDKRGAVVLWERLSRAQVQVRLANMAPCLVGMEACVGAHHPGRRVAALGHDVRLMAAKERTRSRGSALRASGARGEVEPQPR